MDDKSNGDELLKSIDISTMIWLESFSEVIRICGDDAVPLAKLATDSVLKILTFGGQPIQKEPKDDKTNRLINSDGSLNLKEWLKDLGDGDDEE